MTAPRRALVSVSDKTGLIPFVRGLVAAGYEIISTGGTAWALEEAGVPVTPVSAVTGFPEILDGRVKTLHPAIAGAILADGPRHEEELARHGISPIDLVVVNLYPFKERARRGLTPRDLIEWIDIGGVTLLRAAAKNWARVTVVSDPGQYGRVVGELREHGQISEQTRRALALDAFARTASYDGAIVAGLSDGEALPPALALTYQRASILRYGENPHQRGALYVAPGAPSGEVTTATQLQGKELSFNNLVDLDAAWQAVREFDAPAAVVIKHATPSGAAIGGSLPAAVRHAIEADPVSAFGGIVAVNRAFDREAAAALGTLFLEALIAPEITPGVLEVLASRKGLRVLSAGSPAGGQPTEQRPQVFRSLPGGLLVQDADPAGLPAAMRVVTHREPTPTEWDALRLAWLVCKHVRSNAIVLAKDSVTVGIGAGQMSRVDSVRLAAMKAGERSSGSALASDGFFPFADGIEAAAEAGVTAVIQPGGSIRDAEVIAAADARGMAMVFTGRRHFRH